MVTDFENEPLPTVTKRSVIQIENSMITFGKYKGQPIEVLASDPQYCEWLSGQDWFRNRYTAVYNVIVNNFSKPEDTPEHNKLQALFLDEQFIKRVLDIVFPIEETINKQKKYIEELKEERNYAKDHRFGPVRPLDSIQKEIDLSEKWLLYFEERGNWYDKIETDFEVWGWDVYVRAKCNQGTTEETMIEIKPSVGDDFPTVMRQMKANVSSVARRCRGLIDDFRFVLVYKDFTAEGVDEQTMRKMFNASGFRVFSFDEITNGDDI